MDTETLTSFSDLPVCVHPSWTKASISGYASTLSSLSWTPELLKYIVLPPEVGSERGADLGPSKPPVSAGLVIAVSAGLVIEMSRRGICARFRLEVFMLDRRVEDIRPRVDRHQRGTYRRKKGRSVGRQAQMMPTFVSTEPEDSTLVI